MSESKPEAKDNAAADPAPEEVKAAELTEQDLDRAAGGAWPYTTTSYSPGGIKGG